MVVVVVGVHLQTSWSPECGWVLEPPSACLREHLWELVDVVVSLTIIVRGRVRDRVAVV